MTVLIVEDEFYNRKALVKMVQDVLDESDEILEASNGREALDIINENDIEIICTDIRMPEMDGLELIEVVSSLNKDILIMVISGFAEFEYAQKALRFGVDDYLLKPIKKQIIQEKIKAAKSKVAFKNNQIKEKATIKVKLEEANKALLVQGISNLILYGELNDLEGLKTFFGIGDKPYCYCLIAFKIKENTYKKDFNFIEENIIADVFSIPVGNIPMFQINNYIVMIAFDFKGREHMSLITLPAVIKKLSQMFNNALICMGTSSLSNKIENMDKAYEEAFEMSLGTYFDSTKKVFSYEDIGRGVGLSFEQQEQLKGLKYRIYLQDSKQVFLSLEFFFQLVKENMSVGLLLAVDQLITAISVDRNFDSLVYDAEEKENIPVFHTIRSGKYNDLESYFLNMTNYIVSVCYRNDGATQTKGKNIVETAKMYVEDHYQDQISQEVLAKEVLFVNTSYFSRIFKAYENLTFSKYLKSFRLGKAKELLGRYDYPLAHISGMVGFNDTSYFVNSFKNQFGTTPGEYRIKKGESDDESEN